MLLARITFPASVFLATCGVVVACYAAGSIAWSSGDWMLAASLLASIIGGYVMGVALRDTTLVWAIFIFVAWTLGVWYLFWPVLNPNIVGCVIVVAIAAALMFEWWWISGLLVGPLAATQSRGSVIAAGLVALVALWKYSRLIAVCVALIGLTVAFTLKPDASSMWARLGIWQDTISHLTLFGSGFGSFQTEYLSWPVHTNMTEETARAAYSDFLQLAFELGLGMIPLWFLIAHALESDQRLPVVAFLALSLTFFPLYIPILGTLWAFALGAANKGAYHGKMEAYGLALPQRS